MTTDAAPTPTRDHPGRAGYPAALRERAAAMRREGIGRATIARELGIGFSTVARWFREGRTTPSVRLADRQAARLASLRTTVDERWAHQQLEQDAHRDAVGPLTERELLLIGAALYWAEGTKSKPWRRSHRVIFMNSDPSMIRAFVAFLSAIDVPRESWACSVSIHESADAGAAILFWREVVGHDVHFYVPQIKRHRPTTVRLNIGEDYHGCLALRLRGGAAVYRRLAGTWEGVAKAIQADDPPSSSG